MQLSSISLAITSLTGGLFSPQSIFTTGVNGAWYDPSDFSTMFQDAAGTLPVTAVGQPVGLMLDKSKGLVLGPELVTNGDFSQGTTGWILDAGWTVSNGVATTTVSVSKTIYQQSSNIVAGKSYKVTYTASGASVNAVRINVRSPSDNLQTEYINLNGPVSVVFTATTSGAFGIYCYASGVTIDNISVRELPGNHAFNPSGNSANFPVLQQDGTGRYYLAFNGVNQWMQTNSIDFTYGDKMFVSAGVRKLSDAGRGMLIEATGGFNVSAPATASPTYSVYNSGSNGIGPIVSASVFPAPESTVLSFIGDIATPRTALRRNSSIIIDELSSLGVGNYGNYPMYIGARGGASLWFNGRLYGLVVAGKAASASEIASTEAWLNQKTGAY